MNPEVIIAGAGPADPPPRSSWPGPPRIAAGRRDSPRDKTCGDGPSRIDRRAHGTRPADEVAGRPHRAPLLVARAIGHGGPIETTFWSAATRARRLFFFLRARGRRRVPPRDCRWLIAKPVVWGGRRARASEKPIELRLSRFCHGVVGHLEEIRSRRPNARPVCRAPTRSVRRRAERATSRRSGSLARLCLGVSGARWSDQPWYRRCDPAPS